MAQSLAHQFLTFCRSKPADEAYNYSRAKECALSQFAEASGHTSLFDLDPLTMLERQRLIYMAVNHENQTFGALADRLESALASK